ncbi:aminotransferase class IV family protein [Cognatishimia maritima]|uniref:Probable branched-chain-amino-acid aminotransferase n=1 Tax=Cognatishimia maritima TaxID=870908 RepID=A0A1M5KPT8_9RHOB|nr:aminotransferase class IV family protein [Cognatishimia maritima]SHG54529.1 4-amino-4-deoxychorismate lyase [Cognatishimia maritima]
MESTIRGGVPVGTRLIETFGWTPEGGYARLDMHLARMADSARQLGFGFDAAAAQACLKAQGDVPLRCRLTLGAEADAEGFEFTSAPLAPNPASWTVAIAEQKLMSSDVWLRHKTTQRQTYDAARANLPSGIDELIFLNENNEICEGTITNIFVTLPDGRCITPPISCGLLPGVLRQSLLQAGKVTKAVVTQDMLRSATALHVGNSLRGLIPAKLV